MCEVADESQNEINQSYCFKWNDYQNHLSDVVRQLLEDDCMVDVTLAAAGERIHAHRIVLSACSTLFQVIKSAKCVFVFDTILKHIKFFFKPCFYFFGRTMRNNVYYSKIHF